MPEAILFKVNDYQLDVAQEADAHMATAYLVALILKPKSRKYRRRRWLAFLGKEKDRLKKSGSWMNLSPLLRKAINKEFKSHGKSALKAKPSSHYLPSPKKAKDKSELRDIFSVGLLTMVLEEIHSQGTVATIEEAKEIVAERYDGGYWSSNSRSLGAAWGDYKSVAHLCAAWLRLLTERDTLHKDRRDAEIIKEKLPEFLAYAAHYQHFLTKAKASGRAFFNRHKRSLGEVKARNILHENAVWSVAELVEIKSLTKIGKLPAFGRRSVSASGI